MENNQSSITALVTAFSRAYHSLNITPKIFDDFLARQMFTDEEWTFLSKNVAAALEFFDPELSASVTGQSEALEWVMKLQNAPVTLSRSRYCEDTLHKEMEHGTGQYVILGAGFDTFAFRRTDLLDNLNVFEIDHPATQAFKIKRIGNLGWKIPPAASSGAFGFFKRQSGKPAQKFTL